MFQRFYSNFKFSLMVVSLFELEEVKENMLKLIPEKELREEAKQKLKESGGNDFDMCLLKVLCDWFKSTFS